MRRLLALLALAVSLGCSSGTLVRAPMEKPTADPVVDGGPGMSPGDADLLSGRWTGTGIQSNGQRWEIIVDIAVAEGVVTTRVTYPSSGCGGEWRLTSTGSPKEWSGEETLAYGVGACVNYGIVHVRLSGESLEFDWRTASGSGMTARGTLRRARR